MERIPITEYGYKKLNDKLNTLNIEKNEVLEIREDLSRAGDVAENTEFIMANDRLDKIEETAAELSTNIACAQVINPEELDYKGKVLFGSLVTVENIDENSVSTFRIVGSPEVNFFENGLSVKSPLGQKLIGKEEDDEVVANGYTYVIEKIIHP